MDRQVDLDNDGRPRTFRLAVALNHADIDLMNRAFIGDVVKALVAIGFALFAGSWLQIMLGLRPLAQLQRSLAAIRKGRSARLQGDFPSEVAPLAQEFNTLLFRHADSLRKARERAGSLAHGLKTPLTILSAEASALDDRGIHDASEVLREQLAHMRRHVERELARARSHGSAAPGELHTDAKLSVARLMDLMRRMPRGGDLEFVNALPEGLSLPIDPDDFGEIVGNLLDNARKYARSEVAVVAANVQGRPAIVIDDDGPGVPPHSRERIPSAANGRTSRRKARASASRSCAIFSPTTAPTWRSRTPDRGMPDRADVAGPRRGGAAAQGRPAFGGADNGWLGGAA